MRVRFLLPLLGALLLLLEVPSALLAQGTGWQASYWNNTTLVGEPLLTRSEAEINYNWGAGSPDPALPADQFSARWTRLLNLPGGSYRFTVTADDGVRLWVDERLLIDQWRVHSAQSFSAEIALTGGPVPVRLEYFEDSGLAVARLSWVRLGTGAVGRWQGEYFNNIDLAGPPALVRSDNAIDFNWGTGSPVPGIVNADRFSVRWSRSLDLPGGRYRFTVRVDDGVRLWVNNQLLIDRWQAQSTATYTGDITLGGGAVPVRVEYFEERGGALVQLAWAQISDTVAPAPAPGATWRGEYYNNITFNGPPALVRPDREINFNWGAGSPASEIRTDRFAIRWTTTLDLPPGRYDFTARADDGIRVWVNNQLIIDEWIVEAIRTVTAGVDLPGGAVPIRVDYYENTSLAYVNLTWTGRGAAAPTNPNPGAPTAQVTGVQFLNVRTGPSVNFAPIRVLRNGDQVELLARNFNATWVQVRLSDGAIGWTTARYLTFSVRLADLPLSS